MWTAAAAGTAGQNLLPGVADTPLPKIILDTVNSAPVNIAASDILPSDAKFATLLGTTACGPISAGTQFTGLGYAFRLHTAAMNSYFSPDYVNLVNFDLSGVDPFTPSGVVANQVPAQTIIPVGAAALLVLVNTTNQNPTGFGDARVRNINRGTLAGFLTGFLGRTADILPQSFAGVNATYYATTALLAEPLSGAYRVMEHSIANNKEIARTQDFGNCVANQFTVVSNPLNLSRTIGGT